MLTITIAGPKAERARLIELLHRQLQIAGVEHGVVTRADDEADEMRSQSNVDLGRGIDHVSLIEQPTRRS